MHTKYILLFIANFLFNSCGVSQMNVYNGKFQAIKSPNIHGNQRYLDKGEYKSIYLVGNHGGNETVKLNGINNNSLQGEEYSLPDSIANISYRIINTTAGIDWSKVYKKEAGYYGFGFGGQPYPYVYGKMGINEKYFEIGSSILIGVSSDEATYDGEVIWTNNQLDGSWEEREIVDVKKANLLHTFTSASISSSVFAKGFSLNYVGTIGWPWGLLSELPSKSTKGGEGKYEISFDFPYLLSNDIGISYRFGSVSIGVGYNQIVGKMFEGRYGSVCGNIGYNY